MARQSAEGQVSAKEDELLNAKLELLKLTQQVITITLRFLAMLAT